MSVEFRNLVRGGAGYKESRHQIFQIASHTDNSLDVSLTPFLRNTLFELKKSSWYALSFDYKDWKALDLIQTSRTKHYDNVYLSLVLSYIVSNARRVQEMYARSKKISQAIWADDGDAVKQAVESMEQIDRQSLFTFRASAATQSFSDEKLADYFQSELKTDWLRKRFLYPLVYQAINAPDETHLDYFLSYVVSGDEEPSERETIKFLLRDDIGEDVRIGFKAYIALLCHPFDACEIILNHIELVFCETGQLPEDCVSALIELSRSVSSERIKTILRFSQSAAFAFSIATDKSVLDSQLGLDDKTTDFLANFVDIKQTKWSGPATESSALMKALHSMRSSRYPTQKDFETVTKSARSWWFCDGGRLLGCLITSLYMIPRRNILSELRDALRLVGFYGQLLPFFLAAPSSAHLLRKKFSKTWKGASVDAIIRVTSEQFSRPADYTDRVWIKAVHWRLRDAEEKLALKRWFGIVKSEFKVRPAYLTGVNWSWVEEIISKSRLAPFLGNVDGIYALLLKAVEERNPNSSQLRVAIEPFAKNRSMKSVIEWLIQTYQDQAVSFARFLLTVDNILALRIAPNLTAALAARVYALETCIRSFDYTEVLPQEIFQNESETLVSALLLSSVNSGQFEIPWTMYESSAVAKHTDLYTAAHTLSISGDTLPLLSEAKISSPVRYRNGKTVKYTFANKLAPMATLAIALIDGFLEHPGFGLEALLSTRFRHDTLRREFASTLEKCVDAQIYGVSQGTRRRIVQDIEKAVLAEIDRWLNRYMQSDRPECPDGLFDLVPDQEEMLELLSKLDPSSGFRIVIENVCRWLRVRLESQVASAKMRFVTDVGKALDEKLVSEFKRLSETQDYRSQDLDAMKAAVGTAMRMRVDELGGWFATHSSQDRKALTFEELRKAADGLFESERSRGAYRSQLASHEWIDRSIDASKVRLCFDLLREIFASAVKNAGSIKAIVRISPWRSSQGEGFSFSNLARETETTYDSLIDGDPYKSLNDAIFREGNSGLAKIASLSATICGDRVKIHAIRRERLFHLRVIFWPKQTGPSQSA